MKTRVFYCVILTSVLLIAASLPAIEEDQPALTGYRALISEIEERAMNANRVVSELETSLRKQETANLKLQKELDDVKGRIVGLEGQIAQLSEEKASIQKELDKIRGILGRFSTSE